VPWYAGIQDSLTALAKRVVLWFAFQRAKQPERIKEVLEMVYSSNGGLLWLLLLLLRKEVLQMV
jgi:hypothetical protein